MKALRYILTLSIAMTLLILSGGCNKVSHNGKLDGQWQIMKIENTTSGSVTTPENPRLYIAINLHIMQLRGASAANANLAYDKKGEKINCDFPYVTTENISSVLYPYGIYSNPVEFTIIKLDGKELVLRTDESLITCRRF